MYKTHYNSIFCDWLSITYSPTDNPYTEVNTFLLDLGYKPEEKSDKGYLYIFNPDLVIRHRNESINERGLRTVRPSTDTLKRPSEVSPKLHGTVFITSTDKFMNFQFKGMFLSYIRSLGLLGNLVSMLASHNYSIARMDIATDVKRDFKRVYANARRRYKPGYYQYGRTKMPVAYRVRFPDGAPTGTIWVGDVRQAIHGTIYDKTKQMKEVYDTDIDPDVVRYELTFLKRIGASLKDVIEPEVLFNEHCKVIGLKRDTELPRWVSGGDFICPSLPDLDAVTPMQRLDKLLKSDTAFQTMLDYADDLGHEGRKILLSKLTAMIVKG